MTDKISISKLIFPIFVPHLLLRAFKSLYFSGKNNSLTSIQKFFPHFLKLTNFT